MSSSAPDSETQKYFEQEIFKATRWGENLYNTSEHHIVRYVLLIILRTLSTLDWNIVPQLYTHAGKWPDIVLETLEMQLEKKRILLFIP